MPHHKQFEKTERRDAKRRLENRPKRARLRHAVRDFRQLASVADAESALPKVMSLLDRGAKIHLIHPRTASRLKSRLAAHLERLRATAQSAAAPRAPATRRSSATRRATATTRSSSSAK